MLFLISNEMFQGSCVDEASIAGVVSRWTKIPVTKMLQGEKEKILHKKLQTVCCNRKAE